MPCACSLSHRLVCAPERVAGCRHMHCTGCCSLASAEALGCMSFVDTGEVLHTAELLKVPMRGRRLTLCRGRGADRAGRAAAHVPVVQGAHPHALRAVAVDEPAVLLAGRWADPHHHAQRGAAPGCQAPCPTHPAPALPWPAATCGTHAHAASAAPAGRSRRRCPQHTLSASAACAPIACQHAPQWVLCRQHELAHAELASKPVHEHVAGLTGLVSRSSMPLCARPPSLPASPQRP